MKRSESVPYSKEICDDICEKISNGQSLRSILKSDPSKYPAIGTFMRWLLSVRDPDFDYLREQYALAREAQAEVIADEVMDISDDGTNDWMDRETRNGDTIRVVDHEHINRSRLRVDSRKWYASVMARKKYGEKSTTELTGKDGGPIQTQEVSNPEELARRIAFALTANKPKE